MLKSITLLDHRYKPPSPPSFNHRTWNCRDSTSCSRASAEPPRMPAADINLSRLDAPPSQYRTLRAVFRCSFQLIREAVSDSNCSLSISHRPHDLIPARTRVFIQQLNFSSPTTHTWLPQQASTYDPMPTPMCLLFGTQRTPTKSSIAKHPIMSHSTKTESESRATTATASEAIPPSYSTVSPVRSKSRTKAQTAKSASASPPPPQPEILKVSSAAQQQQWHQMPPFLRFGSCVTHQKAHRMGGRLSRWYRK
jgi:hypothetical protein